MKRLISGAAVVLLATAAPLWAQDATESETTSAAPLTQALPDISSEPPGPVESFASSQESGELAATDLIGRPVHGASGEAFGTIDNLIVDAEGKLTLVVVDVGEFLGAPKHVAFGFDRLAYQMDSDAIRLVAGVDRAGLEQAPDYVPLAEEMNQHDGQSLTPDEPERVENPVPAN